jgi:hypothetical protein
MRAGLGPGQPSLAFQHDAGDAASRRERGLGCEPVSRHSCYRGVLAAATVSVAAAPDQQPPISFTCSAGQTLLINLGSLHNNGSSAFVVGTTNVVVAKMLVITVDGEPVLSWGS